MATLAGFTRPSDPIESVAMANKISTDIGKVVTVEITPTDVVVTGATISESDRSAIQTSMTAYFYAFLQYGAPISDNPDMSGDRHDRGVTEHAAYGADSTIRRKAWVSGVLKNGAFPYLSKATTSGGTATFWITDTGDSSGNAVFNHIYADTISIVVYGNTASFQPYNPVVAEDKKSITIQINQVTTILILSLVFVSASNGTDVRMIVMGD